MQNTHVQNFHTQPVHYEKTFLNVIFTLKCKLLNFYVGPNKISQNSISQCLTNKCAKCTCTARTRSRHQ